jgi:hypothetical protein
MNTGTDWKCAQTGARCYDMPDDCSLVCVCAARQMGKVTDREIAKLEDISAWRRRGLAAVDASLREMIGQLDAAEAFEGAT